MKLPNCLNGTILKAGTALTVLAGAVSATTIDFTSLYATIGNSTNLVFFVFGLFLDGVNDLIPKMYTPIILVAVLSSIVIVIYLLPTLVGALVGLLQGAMSHGGKNRRFL